MTKKTTLLSLLLMGLCSLSTVQAGTLENMERERAVLIETLLSSELTPGKRQQQVTTSQRRLVDLERMVLRDKSLVGKSTPAVRTAFENYDLTFLVHASTEKDKLLLDHWLEQMDITTSALMNARIGRQ